MLTINGTIISAAPGPSLFEYAEQLGVKVPTSCQKQGKCKECLMEIVEGMECLTAPTEEGTYEYFCTYPGHYLIMWGQLIVTRDVDGYLRAHPQPNLPSPSAKSASSELE